MAPENLSYWVLRRDKEPGGTQLYSHCTHFHQNMARAHSTPTLGAEGDRWKQDMRKRRGEESLGGLECIPVFNEEFLEGSKSTSSVLSLLPQLGPATSYTADWNNAILKLSQSKEKRCTLFRCLLPSFEPGWSREKVRKKMSYWQSNIPCPQFMLCLAWPTFSERCFRTNSLYGCHDINTQGRTSGGCSFGVSPQSLPKRWLSLLDYSP